ncbi:unnamed protein product, partial [Rotaria magnacalcarata]
ALVQGNVLVIFEGLDEVPAHVDRSDLMKEINTLLERGIDYDVIHDKLTYSVYEKKEINNTKDPLFGNRFIITSRIEGNYFEDINFYIPRLIIEDMTNDALKLFSGLFNEFGQNSFRFIHRTFQEYLAAKSIIYSNGSERSEDMIYEIIKSRIGIPNWRVPLSMTFGILSKLSQ